MAGFEGVQEAIDAKYGGGADQPTETQESAPRTDNHSQENTQSQAQAVIDLSKAEKFMLDGKEYTYDKLRKEMLMQADYTRKTQEYSAQMKEFGKKQELYNHFQADLPKVLENPDLIRELAQHYPKEFVQMAQRMLDTRGPTTQTQTRDQGAITEDKINRLIESKVNGVRDQFASEQAQEKLDVILTQMKTKYPEFQDGRMERFVLSELRAMADQDIQITGDKIEDTFKNLNEWLGSSRESYHKAQLKKQSEANKKGSDMGAGGGTPGQAPNKLKLKDVPNALQNHLSRTIS